MIPGNRLTRLERVDTYSLNKLRAADWNRILALTAEVINSANDACGPAKNDQPFSASCLSRQTSVKTRSGEKSESELISELGVFRRFRNRS